MDWDTHFSYHKKVRKLQTRYPHDWERYAMAYQALAAETWTAMERVALEDAWVPAASCSIADARTALREVGLIDDSDRLPEATWKEWSGRYSASLEQRRDAAPRGGAARARTGKRDKSGRYQPDTSRAAGTTDSDGDTSDAPARTAPAGIPAGQVRDGKPAGHEPTTSPSLPAGLPEAETAEPSSALGSALKAPPGAVDEAEARAREAAAKAEARAAADAIKEKVKADARRSAAWRSANAAPPLPPQDIPDDIEAGRAIAQLPRPEPDVPDDGDRPVRRDPSPDPDSRWGGEA